MNNTELMIKVNELYRIRRDEVFSIWNSYNSKSSQAHMANAKNLDDSNIIVTGLLNKSQKLKDRLDSIEESFDSIRSELEKKTLTQKIFSWLPVIILNRRTKKAMLSFVEKWDGVHPGWTSST